MVLCQFLSADFAETRGRQNDLSYANATTRRTDLLRYIGLVSIAALLVLR